MPGIKRAQYQRPADNPWIKSASIMTLARVVDGYSGYHTPAQYFEIAILPTETLDAPIIAISAKLFLIKEPIVINAGYRLKSH